MTITASLLGTRARLYYTLYNDFYRYKLSFQDVVLHGYTNKKDDIRQFYTASLYISLLNYMVRSVLLVKFPKKNITLFLRTELINAVISYYVVEVIEENEVIYKSKTPLYSPKAACEYYLNTCKL